jgi:hypothetical protein
MCPMLHMWLNGWTNKPNQTQILIIICSVCISCAHWKMEPGVCLKCKYEVMLIPLVWRVQEQNNYSLQPSITFTCLNNKYTSSGIRGAPKAGDGGDCCPPHNQNLKNTFCIKDDIKRFMWFTLQPESATEFDW